MTLAALGLPRQLTIYRNPWRLDTPGEQDQSSNCAATDRQRGRTLIVQGNKRINNHTAMIPTGLEHIDEAQLQALIENPVREKRSIDYKAQLYGNDYAQHREFLADVSSFANGVGGDLVIGVKERGGLPVALSGIETDDIDAEIQRLQQVLLHGLGPRLSGCDFHPVPLASGNFIVVIRTVRSWNAPHRVILKGHDKFYVRDTNGKHPMNVDELREAFVLADRIEQRIRQFRRQRFHAIPAHEIQVPLFDGATLILHLIPLSAFATREALPIQVLDQKRNLLRPIGSGGSMRINLDGILFYSGGPAADGKPQISNAYTQLYRNGIIEAVTVMARREDREPIPSQLYEEALIEALGPYLQAQRELGILPPVYLFLGFVNARGHRFAVNKALLFRGGPGLQGYLDRDDIELPEAVVEDLNAEPIKVLRPLFDQIWNAFGFERSLNFDEHGNWTGQH